jgi:hypothetical protein
MSLGGHNVLVVQNMGQNGQPEAEIHVWELRGAEANEHFCWGFRISERGHFGDMERQEQGVRIKARGGLQAKKRIIIQNTGKRKNIGSATLTACKKKRLRRFSTWRLQTDRDTSLWINRNFYEFLSMDFWIITDFWNFTGIRQIWRRIWGCTNNNFVPVRGQSY